MDTLIGLFDSVQQWLFEQAVQPLLFAFGFGNFLEDGFNATAWLLVGVLQIIILLAVIGPLQHWRPVEPVTNRATIRTDILYTLIHRLGVFRLVLFFSLDPWFDEIFGAVRTAGYGTFHLDQLWPGVTDIALVSFVLYLVVFDFVGYWTHRGQHYFDAWWRLHALHHAQQQMTMWSDNRNHVLDDVIVDGIVVVVAQIIGVPPGQFVALTAFMQLSESLQHANVRLHFGRIGERLWVSPRFHRLHHSIGIGHERPGQPQTLGGCNFAVLMPVWDVIFGSANFAHRYDPTGVRDQVEMPQRHYGRGFWAQQWLGFKRLAGRA